jgi:hypothetical protein
MSRLAERTPVRPAPAPVWNDALPAVVVGAGLVLAYTSVYPLFGLHVTIGSDAPVYAWWARVGGALGMGPLGTGIRPGSIGLVATLSRVTRAPAAGVVAATIPALAAATGLAAGAVSELALGADRLRFFLVAVFVGSYLTLLADGYLSTFAFLTAFVAALACMVSSLIANEASADGAEPRVRPANASLVCAGGLILAAGLAHPLLLGLAGAVVAGGIVGILPIAARALRRGTPFWSTGAARVGAAGLAGAILLPGGLALSGGFAGTAVVTSRDAILRNAGRSSLLRSSYMRKLTHDFAWYRVLVVLGLAATPLLGLRDAGAAWRTERARFVWGAAIAWVAAAVAGVVVLLAGISVPGQRLAATCLALPLLAGVGLAAMWGRSRAGAWRVAAAAGAVLFLVLAWSRWLGARPLDSPAVLTDARAAAVALAGTPPGTPLVVVMDDRTSTPTIGVIRYLNDLRGGVPPAAAGRMHVFLGMPADLLASRPTITGQPEHDAYSRSSWETIRRLSERPLVVAVRAFDPVSFQHALNVPGAKRIAPGVVVLPGSAPIEAISSPSGVGSGPQSPWLPVWDSALLLVIASAAGWPFTALVLDRNAGRLRWALAPAFGFAALMLASVLVDGAGLRLSGAGGWVALAVAAVPAWVALIWSSARAQPSQVES